MTPTVGIPQVEQEEFKPPLLLFPADRVAQEPVPVQMAWSELGPAIQDKYRTKAYWLIKQGHVLQRDAEEVAIAIYHQNPSMFVL